MTSPYPFRHSGPVLVCGSAWCLHDDYARAREIFPDAPVIAVNGAAGEVPSRFLFSQHPLSLPRWIGQQRERFGSTLEVHAAGERHRRNRLGKRPNCPWVDYWWDGIASGGTSAGGARRLAKALGFAPVILCGAPLDPGPYAYRDISKLNMKLSVMRRYRSAVEADVAHHEGAYSMSGWTRQLLKEPC